MLVKVPANDVSTLVVSNVLAGSVAVAIEVKTLVAVTVLADRLVVTYTVDAKGVVVSV